MTKIKAGKTSIEAMAHDWTDEECERIGASFAASVKKRTSGTDVIDDWKTQFTQLETLLKEVEGFEEFMLVIANSLLHEKKGNMR